MSVCFGIVWARETKVKRVKVTAKKKERKEKDEH